jgi:hypothetical protein
MSSSTDVSCRRVLPCDNLQDRAIKNRPGQVNVTHVSVKARKPGGGGYTTRYGAEVSCTECASSPCMIVDEPQPTTQRAVELGHTHTVVCGGPFNEATSAACSTASA